MVQDSKDKKVISSASVCLPSSLPVDDQCVQFLVYLSKNILYTYKLLYIHI